MTISNADESRRKSNYVKENGKKEYRTLVQSMLFILFGFAAVLGFVFLRFSSSFSFFYGFLRVAAATPKIKVADCEYNKDQMIELIEKAAENRVKVLVFPELCITGYTCSDLFEQDLHYFLFFF